MTLYLTQLVPSSKTNRDHTVASLTELAHSFANTPVDVGDKNTLTLFRKALKSFRNADTIVTKPDNVNGVVLLDRFDYLSKLKKIMKNRSKFMNLDPSNKYKKTAQVEIKRNRHLKQLRYKSEIEEEVYYQIRSAGASRPRLHR